MTEEEKFAEEYVIIHARQYTHNDGKGFVNNIEEVKQAFFAGYEAGKPKWHKVSDGDVPYNNRDVLSDKGDIVYYDLIDGCWVDTRASVEIYNVVAWCEIPEYTEEESEEHGKSESKD